MTDPQSLAAHQARILDELGGMSGREHRVQVEAWEDGTLAHLLVAVQGPGKAQAWVVRHDAALDEWTGGCANVAPCASHHDRAAIVEGVPLSPLTAADMGRLGILGDGGSLADAVLAAGAPPQRPGLGVLSLPTGMGKTAMMAQMAGRIHRRQPGHVPPSVLGYPSGTSGRLSSAQQGRRVRAPGSGAPPPGIVRLSDGGWDALPSATAVDEARRLVEAALRGMAGRHHAGAAEILGPATWTPQAHAFYARPGRTGERRRQAGRLYPALAPAIAASDAVAALIDAGRPYEDALCGALSAVHGAAPTAAALRRMRHLPRDAGFDQVVEALDAAMRLPVDWLPGDGAGWRSILRTVGPLATPATELGLRLADVVAHAHGAWGGTAMAAPVQAAADLPGRDSLEAAKEMARRLRDTLLRPVLQSRGQTLPDAEGLRLAGAILFGGKALPGIHGLQRRWHAGLAALEARLPRSDVGHAWPAAFPPFEAGDGIVVACLTNEAALKAEGGRGPDADGIRGLDHCVGGYGRACYAGESFVASIRRVADAGTERLSTVEFERAGDGSLAPVQHFGRSNALPPEEAVAALDGLMRAVADGDHPVEDLAGLGRDIEGYRDGYDWRTPGAMERALAAWSPFLARDIARGGIEGLRARIERTAGILGPAPARRDAGPRIVVIDAGNVAQLLDGRMRARAEAIRAAAEEDPRPPGP